MRARVSGEPTSISRVSRGRLFVRHSDQASQSKRLESVRPQTEGPRHALELDHAASSVDRLQQGLLSSIQALISAFEPVEGKSSNGWSEQLIHGAACLPLGGIGMEPESRMRT